LRELAEELLRRERERDNNWEELKCKDFSVFVHMTFSCSPFPFLFLSSMCSGREDRDAMRRMQIRKKRDFSLFLLSSCYSPYFLFFFSFMTKRKRQYIKIK
jgi:hypothetical protein